MVILCAAIHNYTLLHFFESNHIEVARELTFTYGTGGELFALDQAKQGVFRWGETDGTVKIANRFIMIHDLEVKLYPHPKDTGTNILK